MLLRQQRLLMGAVLTLLVGERPGGAHWVPAIVELEEVVEEVVRAYSWKAYLQEPNIGVTSPLSTSPEGHDQRVGTELAYFCDENWAMHRKPEQRTRECVRCEMHCSA